MTSRFLTYGKRVLLSGYCVVLILSSLLVLCQGRHCLSGLTAVIVKQAFQLTSESKSLFSQHLLTPEDMRRDVLFPVTVFFSYFPLL